MSSSIPKFADAAGAARLVSALSGRFAVVANPPYIHPPYEVYPLAPGRAVLDGGLRAAVMDMDGTTTTTEPLCIHALDSMVRRACGRAADPSWPGLDHEKDYPHIIGNSTTKHVEHLVRAYGDRFQDGPLRWHYIHAAAWTLECGRDAQRRREVRNTMAAVGVGALEGDGRFAELRKKLGTGGAAPLVDALAAEYGGAFGLGDLSSLTRACIDIYYHRYHEVLELVGRGRGAEESEAVLGVPGARLIGPMPGIGVFLALLRGLLGADAAAFADGMAAHLEKCGVTPPADMDAARARLAALGRCFETRPARVALVTSSIAYEADLVLGEVFRVLRGEVPGWPVPEARREKILAAFASPEAYYDGIITATDSSEIRLKPHRDLYSIAMHELGVNPDDFGRVVGFEDSESGTIAIRAAGIQCCCALPFHMTAGHLFEAATNVCPGGLPEVMLNRGVFLDGV